ncbi:PorV/PorQ family protein [bacterium]|nr:PorV/PorQ family protein [bacterium]MBU0899302.1 PorV/PorQ family protein [bacterium]MBU1153111.1 PorV/PorQ family protein [bacterium]MBU1782138.1 PorV/PorQ family protein [bacterium]MBU2599226.1 PorV/PorQ family protein [bacterium]
MFTKMIIAILSLTLLLPLNIDASSVFDIGTTTATFLKLGIGARASALGETYVAIANDATAPHWNPAGLVQIKKEEIMTMYNKHFQGINHGYLSYVTPINKGKSAIGISVLGLIVDDIEVRVSDTLEPDSISKATDLAGILSYGTEVAKYLSLGLNLKLIKSKIIDSKSDLSYTGDVGLLFKKDRLSLGAVYTNLGGKLKYKDKEEPIHQCLKAGVALSAMKNHLLLSVDVNLPNDNKAHYHSGVEISLANLALRAGYLTGPKDIGKNFTAGFGLKLGSLFIDYAFVPYGDLGDTHQVSLGIRI